MRSDSRVSRLVRETILIAPALILGTAHELLIAFTLAVFREGRLVNLYENLSAVPRQPRYAPVVLSDRHLAPSAPLPLVVVRAVNAVASDDDLPF